MGVPIYASVALATADADGIAQLQTPGAAGNLTLNGALVTSGVAILVSAYGAARQVLVTTVADESGKTLTIYGTNATGNAITETITGPNVTTGTTVAYFRTVTRVAVSAAFTGNVTVGTNGVGGTRWIPLDLMAGTFEVSVGAQVSGTVNYTCQFTYDNPESITGVFDDATMVGDTAAEKTSFLAPISALRIKVNSGTGTVSATVIQSGIGY